MNCLEKSIQEKWEPILRGEHGDNESYDCPCCQEYNRGGNECEGCPISEHTGYIYCGGTPYVAFCVVSRNFLHGKALDLHAECTAAAQWEIDFLNEVLEKQK